MTNFKRYLISDTLYNKVYSDRLKTEIANSSITIALDYINTDSLNLDIYFKSNLTQNEITTLDGIVTSHNGNPPTIQEFNFDVNNSLITSNTGIAGWKETYISHNWCDKTTWYQSSVRVTDELLINSGDNLTYNMSEPKIVIDVTHNKISDENYKTEIIACRPIVKINGSSVYNGNPLLESYYVGITLVLADYSINYQTGQVTFNVPLDPEDEVTLSYNKLPITDTNNEYGTRQSSWVLRAPQGHKVLLNRAEAQFSVDTRMKDAIRFVAYSTIGLDPALDFLKQAPFYYPDGMEIPLPMLNPEIEKRFNTLGDFIDDADGCYDITATPNTNRSFRDLHVDMRVYKWRYEGNENMTIDSSLGRFIRVFLKDDVVFEGTRCTSTLYGTKFAI